MTGAEASCVFCAIAAGDAKASVVHDDDEVLAFLDVQPVTVGHVLVVPRRHVRGLEDLDPGLGRHMFEVAQKVARGLRASGLPCEGINLFLADGEAAFQEVPHVHLHVFPRTVDDGFRIDAAWRMRERTELDETARQVRRGLARVAVGD